MSQKLINKANEALLGVKKSHLIRGGGCPTKESQKTVQTPRLQPCFYLYYGNGKEDRIETEDYEIMMLEAVNPYNNVTMENLTVVSLSLKYLHEGKEVAVPVAQYTNEKLADLTPSRMITFGTLGPNESLRREVVLGTFRTPPGDYRINLEYVCSVSFNQHDKDMFTISIGVS